MFLCHVHVLSPPIEYNCICVYICICCRFQKACSFTVYGRRREQEKAKRQIHLLYHHPLQVKQIHIQIEMQHTNSNTNGDTQHKISNPFTTHSMSTSHPFKCYLKDIQKAGSQIHSLVSLFNLWSGYDMI